MDANHVEDRLRSLGAGPVDATVAARHLAGIHHARPRRRAVGAGAALGAAVALLSAAGGLALMSRPEPASITPRGPAPDLETPVVPGAPGPPVGDPCVGPPPFAGVEPESEEARAAEAAEFSEFRETQCPDDEGDGADSDTGAPPVGDHGCVGPPPFAGVAETDGLARAAEARARAAQRAACGADAATGPEGELPVPPTAPSGGVGLPPVDVPDGPPEETPDGPLDDVPDGPPVDVPDGPPGDGPGGGRGGG